MEDSTTAVSFNGRTFGFQPNNDGSEPSTATKPCARCGVNPRRSYHSYCGKCASAAVIASRKRTGYKEKPRHRPNQYKSSYFRRRYREVMDRLQAFKVEQGCKDCGYNAHHAGLELDHLPGNEKFGNISTLAGRGWNSVLKELQKCEVVCGTCHNIRTWNRNHE